MHKTHNKQKILIVDDTKINLAILTDVLKDDYIVITANSGEQALDIIFSDTLPDIILLDVVMTGISGYDVCKKLKDTPLTKNIPIIFITGKISVEDETYGFKLGAVDYISKPFSPVIVKARVNTHSELKKHRDYLESISYLDGLTGVFNRRKFDEYLWEQLNYCFNTNRKLSLMIFDIDHFKAYNDLYGHEEGDQCLKKIASMTSEYTCEKKGLLARYGGEEFASIFVGDSNEEVFEIAENIRKKIYDSKIPNENSLVEPFVTVSIGIASVIPTQETSCKSMIESADKQLYLAKKTGRNKICMI